MDVMEIVLETMHHRLTVVATQEEGEMWMEAFREILIAEVAEIANAETHRQGTIVEMARSGTVNGVGARY